MDSGIPDYRNPSIKEADALRDVNMITREILIAVAEFIQKHQPTAYLANVFKNNQKWKDLDFALSNPPSQHTQQQSLFETDNKA